MSRLLFIRNVAALVFIMAWVAQYFFLRHVAISVLIWASFTVGFVTQVILVALAATHRE